MSLSIDASQPVWRTALSATVTNDDLLALARSVDVLARDGSVSSKGLVDLREMSDVDVDFATLVVVAQEVESHRLRSDAKTGFIARSPMQYGFAGTLQMLLYGQPLEIQVFEDNEDALEWISN